MNDLISRQDAIDAIHEDIDWLATQGGRDLDLPECMERAKSILENLPSAEPERLTDDDFETIRIHLNAYKEKLCNQQRWEEAEEYQRIIDRFMAFASADERGIVRSWEETGKIIRCKDCKHWREGTAFSYCDKLYGMGVLDALDYMVAEDDYCSMAERRTDEA